MKFTWVVLAQFLIVIGAQPISREVCDLDIVIGTGIYRIPRFGFNRLTGRCENFLYSGCCGNANNFDTRQACEDLCERPINPCSIPSSVPRPCSPGGITNTCPSNQYCHVGATRDTTVCCIGDLAQQCQLPMIEGAGTARLPRFYFDSTIGRCLAFTYRGTMGNPNNFLSLSDCESVCRDTNPCADGPAYVDPTGALATCRPSTDSNTCPSAYWCHPGDTFETTICCPGAVRNPCDLPVSNGEGEAQLSRWWYNSGSGNCEPFIYSGLKGNQNNFLREQDCRKSCARRYDNPCVGQPAVNSRGRPIFCSIANRENCPVNFWCHIGSIPERTLCCPGATNPCSVPLAPGSGDTPVQRWYYNADTRNCVAFTYYGMRGNQNNFMTQRECDASCPDIPEIRFRKPCCWEMTGHESTLGQPDGPATMKQTFLDLMLDFNRYLVEYAFF